MSTPSHLVADRYRLVKMLGAGGMGVVWQAWDERLHRPVALKMLRTQPELTDSERQLATDRAMREARITAGLHHSAAVTVFDVVEHDGQPCIVMQLIESTPLSVLLSEHGPLTPSVTARIGAQVGSALAAAHKMRIVHRDVKPGNILITADGSAMISDFGISHALGDATITATGMIHGTPAYLAPEVARGLPTSFASDVFSLGSTLYAMLEGTPPFGSDKNAIALLHKVANGGYPPPTHAGPLAPVLGEMLSTSPKRRPSMASVVESLTAVQERLRRRGGLAGGNGGGAARAAERRHADGGWRGCRDRGPRAGTHPRPRPSPSTPRHDPHLRRTLRPPRPFPSINRLATNRRPPRQSVLPVRSASARVATGSTSARVPPPKSTPSAERPTGRGRRAGVIVGILVLVGALVVARRDAPQRVAAQRRRRRRTRPRARLPATVPDHRDSQLRRRARLRPRYRRRLPRKEEPEAPPPTPEQRAIETISGYYAMLPGDLDSAWPLMTADYQENHAGGRGGYEAFWSTVAALEIADVSASAPDRAQATLTYHFRDGRVVQEVTSFRLVDEGGALKIAATDVLSSSQL